MWSVVMLSPTLSTHCASIVSVTGFAAGKGLMFGPLNTSTFLASSMLAGSTTAVSSIRNLRGILTFNFLPKVVGSVMVPVSAEATAVSGDTKYTCPSAVPLLPSKLRLKVLNDTPALLGLKPIPIHGPHAHSKSLAPDAKISPNAPQSESIRNTCLEPGEIERLTSGEMVLPFNIAATLSISNSEELVQEPIHTWSHLVPFNDSTVTTLSGLCGQAIKGFKVERLMSITLS